MASVEKQTSAKNEYQNRSTFMIDRSKGYGVERHTRVTSLAENGRYISGRKNEDIAIKTGKSSAIAHVKRQAAEKFIGGKMQKAHYNKSEPKAAAAELNTDNTNRYIQGNGNGDTTKYRVPKSDEKTTVTQSEKAAELKMQLKKDVAISKLNDKKEAQKNNTEKYIDKSNRNDNKLGERNSSRENSQKYFSYKRAKAESVYKKKIYRVNKRWDRLHSGKSNINNFTTLRKLAILKQDIVRPIKNGNAMGVAAVPATIYLKKLLEKTRLGRLAARGKEAGSRIISSANGAEDTSQAMYIATQKAASEAVKGVGSDVYRGIRKVHEKNKYMRAEKRIEKAENKANKYLAKTLDKIAGEQAAANSGTASAKLMKKVESFNKKDNAKKQQKKIDAKNRTLDRKIKKQYAKRLKKNNSAIKNLKNKAKLKLIAIAGSALTAIIPILLIIVIIAIVANFVFYPFFYLTKKKDKVDDFGNEYIENEIEDSPVKDTIQHYYEVMDEVVDDFNAEIDKFLNSGWQYDNTGIEDPIKKAQYDLDYAEYQTQYDSYIADYDNYCETYPNNLGAAPEAPDQDYWYSYDELSSKGMERGPIFEGFVMSDESDAERVPKGELYDEMLCTISTFNAKLMTRPDTYKVGTDTEDDENTEVSETNGNNNSENKSSNGSGDIIFMTDETVAGAYGGADFWEFNNWEEGVDCPSSGNCCSKTVSVPHYDKNGNLIEITTEEVEYCPGHYVIMWEIKLDFDLDKVWEEYQFDKVDKKNYKDTKKQFDKDKP